MGGYSEKPALRAAIRVGLAGLVAWSLAPFLWQVLTSLRPAATLTQLPPLLPPGLSLEHYRKVLSDATFLRLIFNSFGIGISVAVVSILIGAFAAFAIAYFDIRGKLSILGVALSVSMLPAVSVLSPIYLFINELGLRDTWTALILSHTIFTLPLTLWTLTNFFKGLPRELYRAGLVDGLTNFQIFRRIYLPLAAGGISTCAILNFIFSWNEFLFALTFTTTEKAKTVPVGIALFAGTHELPFGEIAAASTIVCLPVLVLAMLFQRGIVAGLTQGAVKG